MPRRLLVPGVLELAASMLVRCAECLEAAGRSDLSEWLWCLDIYGKALEEAARRELSGFTASRLLDCWQWRASRVGGECGEVCSRAASMVRRIMEGFIEHRVGVTPVEVTLDAYMRLHDLL